MKEKQPIIDFTAEKKRKIGQKVISSTIFSLKYVSSESWKKLWHTIIGLFTIMIVVFVIRFVGLSVIFYLKFFTKCNYKSTNHFF